MSLRVRLALSGIGLVALALLVFGVVLYALFSRGVFTSQDDALRTRARTAAASITSIPAARAPIAPLDVAKDGDIFVEVMAADGSVLYTDGSLDGSAPGAPALLLDQAEARRGTFGNVGPLRVYVLPIAGGYVMAGQSTRVPQSNLSGLLAFLVIAAMAGLVAAVIGIWVVAGLALAPLKSVALAAEEIGRTRDFARRLPDRRGRDEVALLASSFNGMLVRLQDAYESQTRFVSDASHELRTPLTTIQGNAGLLASRAVADDVRRAAAADVVQESGRMARLVDRLLTLARADSGLRLTRARLDLAPLVAEVGRQAAAQHPERTLTVEAVPASVDGDEDALRQLLWILLDNAFRYAGSAVEVVLTTEDEWARLVVADDGPGVPPEHLEQIFERFYRADQSRTGSHSGLGLSIARWIVTQHNGRIVVGAAEVGGAAFLVDLPLLRPS